MKKLNLKSLLALVLTLCMLLSGVAALAEGFTIADGATPGEVVVTVNDVTGAQQANDGILINAYGDSESGGHVTFNADGAGVVDPNAQAKLNSATTLTVNAGSVTENQTTPYEDTYHYTDDQGQEVTETETHGDVTGVFSQTHEGTTLTSETINVGAINVSTPNVDGLDYGDAYGVSVDTYGPDTVLNVNVNGGITAGTKADSTHAEGVSMDAYRNDANVNVAGDINVTAAANKDNSSAFGVYTEGEQGHVANAVVTGNVTATGTSENARAAAYGVEANGRNWQDEDATAAPGTAKANVTVQGDITATASGSAISKPGEYEDDWDLMSTAEGIEAYADYNSEVVVNATGNVTATATSKEGGARAEGIDVYADGKDSKTAVNVTGNVKAEGSTSKYYADIKGVETYAYSGSAASVTVTGNVDAASNSTYVPVATKENPYPDGGSVDGVIAHANEDSSVALNVAGNVTAKSTAPQGNVSGANVGAYSGTINATFGGNITAEGKDWTTGLMVGADNETIWSMDEDGNETYKRSDKPGTANVSVTGNVTASTSNKEQHVSGVSVDASNGSTATLNMTGNATATNDQGSATAVNVWDNGGTVIANLVGDVTAEGVTYATGMEIWASDNSTWIVDPETKQDKEIPGDKQGNTKVVLLGDVVTKVTGGNATGVSVSAGDGSTSSLVMTGDNTVTTGNTDSKFHTYGLSVNANDVSKVNVAVTGDIKATGNNAYGMSAWTGKTGTANVLVDGTVAGDGAAIYATANNTYITDGKTETMNVDPTKANYYVWKLEANANNEIVRVDDYTSTFTTYADGHVDADGSTGVYESSYTKNEAATAQLEQAIWYIVKVADKWQDKLTATGTGTYTAENGVTYNVAHQYEDVILKFDVPSSKKLSAIYYNDGAKAEYVKNEDGTYTVKMLRGGAMELSLKLKSKEKKAAAATTETKAEEPEVTETKADALVKVDDSEEVNGVKAEDHPEVAKALETIGESLDAEDNVTVTIPGAEKLMDEEEIKEFDTLPVKDRLLVVLSALGFANDSLGDATENMSDSAKNLSENIAERMENLPEDEKQTLLNTIAEEFPKGTVTLDGQEYESFSIDLEINRNGEKTIERYTFYNDAGTWKLFSIEKGAAPTAA